MYFDRANLNSSIASEGSRAEAPPHPLNVSTTLSPEDGAVIPYVPNDDTGEFGIIFFNFSTLF